MAAAATSGGRITRSGARAAAAAASGGGALPLIAHPASHLDDDTVDFLGQRGGRGGGEEVRGVWKRLHSSGVSEAAVSVGWRTLHAVLPVRSRVAHYLRLPLEEGRCEAPGCSCQESLSHALMECGKVRGAVEWLLGVYEAVSGRRPPWDPRVILADDSRVWEPGESKEERLLWQRLRLTVLHHVWRVRSSRRRFAQRGSGDLSAAAISGAAADIQRAIRRDWARTRLGEVREEAGGCWSSFSGRDASLTREAFVALWGGNGVLCRLSTTAPGGLVIRDPSVWI